MWQPSRFDVIQAEPHFSSSLKNAKLEACVAKWLTPRTPDLEVWASSLACHVVSSDKELHSTLSLFTQAPVVQTMDSAIHRIKIYPVDSAIDFRNSYPLDSDLSSG